MAKKELTPEQAKLRRENLARAREIAAANRAKRTGAPPDPEDVAVEETAEEPVIAEPEEASPIELSDHELDRIRVEARKKVDAELAEVNKLKKKEMMAAALDAEIQRQRREAGLTDYRDDLIEFMVNVAPFSPGITIDGEHFEHGRWVKTSRRKYDSMREVMARSWEAEDRAGNPNKKFEAWRQMSGVQNAMFREQRLADGTFTVGLDTRINSRNGAVFGTPSTGA
jgi:hypothetical protein